MSIEWPNQHEGKSWVPSKALARELLRRHRPGRCWKCASGRYLWRWYLCQVGGTKHYHHGHRPINGWAHLSLQAR